jgi:hypothetical protein
MYRSLNQNIFSCVETCILTLEKTQCIILGEGLCSLLCAYKFNVSIREGKCTSYSQEVTCPVMSKLSSSQLYRSVANQFAFTLHQKDVPYKVLLGFHLDDIF